MDTLLIPEDIIRIPWVSIGWFLGSAYTCFKMYQLFVDAYTGTPPGPLKLLRNALLMVIIPPMCFFVWPILLGTILASEPNDKSMH
jgi:hypothetical protein